MDMTAYACIYLVIASSLLDFVFFSPLSVWHVSTQLLSILKIKLQFGGKIV